MKKYQCFLFLNNKKKENKNLDKLRIIILDIFNTQQKK